MFATMIETLEHRRLFALVVTGTPFGDVITVSDVNGPTTKVVVNGVESFYRDADFTQILINAGGGHDRVSVDRTVLKSCFIHGGTGNDVLRGGIGTDVIYGEGGDDRLAGYGGDDVLYGGIGADRLSGGPGRDLLRGGPGNDTYLGNADGFADSIYREKNADVYVGGLDLFDRVFEE